MTQIPDQMKALVLHEPGLLSPEFVPVPTPGPGEVLLRVKAATTCGTDLKAYLRGHPQIPMPGTLGHEYSGVVAAVGEGAPFSVGDELMGVHSAPCQACRWCLRGQENLCESIMATKVLGSYAEYLLIPARIARLNVFLKPSSLSFAEASLLEPLSCVTHGLSQLPLRPDDRVLIIGPGAIGLMFLAGLKLLGVEDVTMAGRSKERLAIAERFGGKVVALSELTGLFDIVIECTGKVEVWEKTPDFIDRGGTIMLFGGPPGGTRASFDTKKLHYDDIRLVSPFHFGTAAVKQAREWLLSDGFDLSPLLTGVKTLDEGPSVFFDLEKGVGIKYVFDPGA